MLEDFRIQSQAEVLVMKHWKGSIEKLHHRRLAEVFLLWITEYLRSSELIVSLPWGHVIENKAIMKDGFLLEIIQDTTITKDGLQNKWT